MTASHLCVCKSVVAQIMQCRLKNKVREWGGGWGGRKTLSAGPPLQKEAGIRYTR